MLPVLAVRPGISSGAFRTATGIALAVLALASCQSNEESLAPSAPGEGASLAASAVQAERVAGSYIVVFKPDVADVPGLAQRLARESGGSLRFTYTAALKGFAAHLPDQALEGLRRNPHVALIEQDGVVEADDAQSSPPSWGLSRIDQRSLPMDTYYTYAAASGAGVNVYILDTGIRSTHRDFGGRVVAAFTAIGDGNGSEDCRGHGTHVAGIVGGTKFGVAKSVRLYSVRVLDCTGSGTYSSIIAGIDWVTKNRLLPAVANMSLSGSSSSTMNTAVQNSIASGVVYTAAAGNSATDACSRSPANVPQVLTVAASNWTDAQSSFSNYGTCVDLYAPGEGITSAFFVNDSASAVYAGTSQAAPHVAGVAALYLSLHPAATPAEVASAIVGSSTANAISGSGAGTPNRLLYSGFMTETIQPPADTVTPPADTVPAPTSPEPPTTSDQAPVATFTANGCPRGKCTFDASGSSDDQGIVSYSWNFGDGSASSSASAGVKVSHAYSAAASYTVTLTVTDAAGQKSSRSQTVTVKRI